jgi:tRNA dimethylallyltransferase
MPVSGAASMDKAAGQGSQAPVLVLFGPTASGKTELLSRLFSGSGCGVSAELVSADSMQVYRGMDIGTAKPSPHLCKSLPHHLIDIRNPDEPFNAGDFVRLADEACAEIAGRGKLPVLCGGTGFYLKNFILGLSQTPPADFTIREELKRDLAEKGVEVLIGELAEKDPQSAARIHKNDTYRLLRALEVCRSSGLPLSSFSAHEGDRPYRFLIVELVRPRAELYSRINHRCGEMFEAGLAGEVKGLFEKGYTPEDPGLRAIGYREFFIQDADGAWGLSEDYEGVQTLVARNSRHYAKRQITFFASIPGLIRLDADEKTPEKILDLLNGLIHTKQS